MTKVLPLLLVVLLSVQASAQPTGPRLAESMVLSPQDGKEREDLEIARWQARARAKEAKADAFERLGWAYVAKARRTLDAGYYKLAEKTAEAMEARFGASPEAQLLRGHVWHNLHRFKEAETVARSLVGERGSPDDLALWSDTLMEQGRLAEAVGALQQLVNLKPGNEAYSRIAQVRWLKGDLRGAIEMMEAAHRATGPHGEETRAWTLARLSALYLQSKDTGRALAAADSALKALPAYPPALLARGRALFFLGKNDEAIGALRRAVELNPSPEYQWWLADSLRATGQGDEAAKLEVELKGRGEAGDPRTLALFLATRKQDFALATRLAREEIAIRADVFSRDALAWALAAEGKWDEAATEIEQALAEKTQDARLFLHAGEIARARGRAGEAQKFFSLARSMAGTLTPSERAILDAGSGGASVVQHP